MFSQVVLITVAVTVVSVKSIDEASLAETESERVIGGKEASPGQFPWAVALFYNNQFICTGSIISPTTVLTAGHCVVTNGATLPVENFYAIANVSKSAENVRIDFASVMPHPDYAQTLFVNDVALFKTTAEIPFSNEVGPICLARPNTPIREYRKATIMGWGNTIPIRFVPIIPDRLQYAEQKIIDNSFCRFVNFGVNEEKICASGGVRGYIGVCNGDSGGPLVAMSRDKKPVQIGITSYINPLVGCGKFVPAVFTRVSAQYDFIMQAANDSSICTV